MASRPSHLQPVPASAALTLVALAEAMNDLRTKVADLFDGTNTVTIALGADMKSFDVSIFLPPLSDPARTEFLLELNPLKDEGIIFKKITTRVLERSCRRRVVMAQIVSADAA